MGRAAVRAIALAVPLVFAACTGTSSELPSPPATAAFTSAGPASSSVAATPAVVPLADRPVIEVRAGGRTLRVVAADDEASWEKGLQGVTDLGSLDGMLFRFHATGTRAFWMKDTLLPLDIAFFDESGLFVSVATMPLCRTDPCPTYVAAAPYATALEARAGSLGFLRAGDRLEVAPAPSQ